MQVPFIKFRAWDKDQMYDWEYLKTWSFSDIEKFGNIYENTVLLNRLLEESK